MIQLPLFRQLAGANVTVSVPRYCNVLMRGGYVTRKFWLVVLVLLVSGCSASENKDDVELTVSAAASLQDALAEIQNAFEKEYPDITLFFNFGASGSLQQQILQGAPVDLFFSAAEDKFANVVHEGFIDQEDAVALVGNEMVVVMSKNNDTRVDAMEDLAKLDGSISIGTPETVPAGKYAKEALENVGVWKDVESNVIYAKDVRQVLTYVETGNVEAGIVYKTDAAISQNVQILATVPEATYSSIIYPIGILKGTKHPDEAKTFYEYLQGDKAMEILQKYGFKRLEKRA